MLTTGDVRLAEEVAQTVTGQGRHRPRWASVREGLTSARGLPGGHGASETAAPGPSAASNRCQSGVCLRPPRPPPAALPPDTPRGGPADQRAPGIWGSGDPHSRGETFLSFCHSQKHLLVHRTPDGLQRIRPLISLHLLARGFTEIAHAPGPGAPRTSPARLTSRAPLLRALD